MTMGFPLFATESIDAREWRRLHGIAALLLLALALPYLWALAITPRGYAYGGLLYNPDDQNVHLAWARQAAAGHFFFRDLFTTESLGSATRPLFTNVFCWIMGATSGLTHVPLILIYHGLRLLCAALALYSFYGLSTLLTEDKRVRLVALLLMAFSGGLGWLQAMLPQFFPDRTFIDRPDGALMMPEAFTFTSAFVFPLNIASIALLPLIYGGVLRAGHTGRLKYAVWAGVAALLLANIHTYDALPLIATLLLWLALRALPGAPDSSAEQKESKAWLASLIVIIFALLPIAYQWLVFRNSEEFRIKALTPTPAPPLLDVVLSYGLLLLLALLGSVLSWQSSRARLMTVWVLVTLLMIYAPVSFARKMIEGLHLPLCFLAATGLVWLLARVSSPLVRRAAAAGAVGLLCISSLRFVGWCLDNTRDNNLNRGGPFMPPLYLTGGDAAAMHFLNTLPAASREQAVLCLPKLGNYAPRETGLHVYIGHWAET
ncbi:MAG TPA: hypothetical protein VNA16_03045, partial [Abditibacteriaceae bacterium]|nr:hypothetical protein [Abditibacteriaceae bacterium]